MVPRKINSPSISSWYLFIAMILSISEGGMRVKLGDPCYLPLFPICNGFKDEVKTSWSISIRGLYEHSVKMDSSVEGRSTPNDVAMFDTVVHRKVIDIHSSVWLQLWLVSIKMNHIEDERTLRSSGCRVSVVAGSNASCLVCINVAS